MRSRMEAAAICVKGLHSVRGVPECGTVPPHVVRAGEKSRKRNVNFNK